MYDVKLLSCFHRSAGRPGIGERLFFLFGHTDIIMLAPWRRVPASWNCFIGKGRKNWSYVQIPRVDPWQVPIFFFQHFLDLRNDLKALPIRRVLHQIQIRDKVGLHLRKSVGEGLHFLLERIRKGQLRKIIRKPFMAGIGPLVKQKQGLTHRSIDLGGIQQRRTIVSTSERLAEPIQLQLTVQIAFLCQVGKLFVKVFKSRFHGSGKDSLRIVQDLAAAVFPEGFGAALVAGLRKMLVRIRVIMSCPIVQRQKHAVRSLR